MATATKEKHPAKPVRKTKISNVIDLLERKDGASLEEISEATSWQKHTVSATLTGLKKKGSLTVQSLSRVDLPLDWQAQRSALGLG